MADFADLRARMVERQLRARGIVDARVLAAMGKVPRERFVPEDLRASAYDDSPLPIGAGQTISQPYIVARMIEAAHIVPGDRVLEVGAGSGYAAAVMARIAKDVFAIERHESLAAEAARRLHTLGFGNVTVLAGDGTRGLAEKAPFDAVLVTAGGRSVPVPLRQQLATGARLIMPVGDETNQSLLCVKRTAEDAWREDELGTVRFVPLIGACGEPEGNS